MLERPRRELILRASARCAIIVIRMSPSAQPPAGWAFFYFDVAGLHRQFTWSVRSSAQLRGAAALHGARGGAVPARRQKYWGCAVVIGASPPVGRARKGKVASGRARRCC